MTIKPIVTLEPRTVGHAAELFAVFTEPALYEFLDEKPPASIEALRQKLARSESRRSPDGSQHWLNWIVRDEAGRIAGNVQATVNADLETNVAYVFGQKFWGRGIASVAVSQMLDIVAREHRVKHFFVVAERANQRSTQLARRLGFTEAPPEVAARKQLTETEILLQKVID